MIKRIMSIGNRSAPADEKAKGWIMILFLIIPALSGYYAIYSKIAYWVTPRNEGLYEITESGFVALDTATVSLFIFALGCAISVAYARSNYRFATVLKEAEKGYHEPITSHSEPIVPSYTEQEEKRDFKIGVSRNGRTDFVPVPMTATQVIAALKRMPLTPNQIRLYMEDYKTWSPVMEYLRERKEMAALQMLDYVPDRPQIGETIAFPV